MLNLALLAVGAFASVTASHQGAAIVSPDETAIRAAISSIEAGWNAGSGERFAAPFAKDADYIVVNGMHLKGRKEIAEGHTGIFNSIYKGSVNQGTIKSVRFVRPDVAISHTEWFLKYKLPNGENTTARAMNSCTWVKSADKWEIVSFQNTPIQPPHP